MNQVLVDSPSPHLKLLNPEKPAFGVVRVIPEGIASQIQDAVHDFIRCSGMPRGVSLSGFYNQTLQAIANAAIYGNGNDLWLGIAGQELWIYLLGSVGQDIDGRLCYTVSQAWVKEDQRGRPWVKWAWEKVRQRAKDCLCGHFMVISTKENDAVYCRFLGRGFHKYASLLKEEL